MNGRSDDEEEDEKVDLATATRRAWYAGQQSAAPLESPGFRGVPGVPHGGSQTVRPEQTAGSMDLCWCGRPFDHDWAGKSGGRPHPRKEDPLIRKDEDMPTATHTAPTEEQPRIERRALRAYNADLADIILTAVNEYHVKYRVTAHSVILFPPDQTKAYAVNARNSDRQVKGARAWFVRHCVPQDISIKQAAKPAPSNKPVDAEDVKELAEAINGPEHLARLDELAKQEVASAEGAPADPPQQPAPTMVATNKPAEPPAETPTEEPAATEPASSEEWVPYYKGNGKTREKSEYYVTNGTDVKCTVDGWIGKPTGTGGHTRTHHTDTTTLWGPKAKEKGVQTYFTNKALGQVGEAINMIQNALEIKPAQADTSAQDAEIKELKAQNKALGTENTDLKTKLTDLKTKLADLEAKQALLRETLGL